MSVDAEDTPTYDLGDSVLLTEQFFDQLGSGLYDPNVSQTLRVRAMEGGSIEDYSTQVTRVSLGNFQMEINVTQPGDWVWEWKSNDSVKGDTVSSGRFYVRTSVIDSPTVGLIGRLVKSLMPVTFQALRDADYYGESLLNERILMAKYLVLPAALAEQDEALYSPLMRDYIATLAAIEIVPAGIEYWMQQKISTSATGVNETTSYTDRQLAFLKSLLPRLLAKAAQLASNPGIITFLVIPGEAPAVSGNDNGCLVTENPFEWPREFRSPGPLVLPGFSSIQEEGS